MKTSTLLLLILILCTIPCSAAVISYNTFDNLPLGGAAGVGRVQFGSQIVALVPDTGSKGMLMVPDPTPISGLSYSQVSVTVPQSPLGVSDRINISFDLYLSGFQSRTTGVEGDRLTVFLDSPAINTIQFVLNGNSGAIKKDGFFPPVGSFAFGTSFHIDISANTFAGTWSAWLNGQTLFSNSIMQRPGHLRTIRFSLSNDTTLSNVPVAYMDNIVIASVPEPTCLVLVWVAAFGLLRRQRILV